MQDSVVEEMEGVEVTETEVDSSPLMTEQEKRILEVYDRLEELQLEIALLRARGILSKDEPVEATEEDIKLAEQDLLKAKALYQVRTNIVENVLVANPILKAVHAGSNASIIEQDLLPLIQQRDELSRTLSKLSSKALSAENELMEIESEHMITAQKNVELATHMLSLADQAKAQKNGDIEDPRLRARLEELDAAMRASRQRWRILKGTASATIAGSGADWARDPKLLEIVMDDDDDDDDD